MKLLHLLALGSSIALAQAQVNNTTDATNCVSGAHVIVARASLEAPGYGILGAVKDQILAKIPNSNAVAVPYPAAIWGPVVYVDSEPEGVGNMTKLIQEYFDACPGRKMVLMGYSQGAQVTGDTLIGSDYPNFGAFPNTTGLAQNYIDSIAAVVMMGDPANVAGQPILKGNSTHNGNFPRGNTAKWASAGLVDKTVSYCDSNDTFCDSGSSLAVHIGYVEEYGSQAVDFVVQKFASAASSSSSSASASSTASATASRSAAASSASASASASPSGSTSAGTTLGSGLYSYFIMGVLQCTVTVWLLMAL